MAATGIGLPEFWAGITQNFGSGLSDALELPGSQAAERKRLQREAELATLQGQVQAIRSSNKPESQKRQELVNTLRDYSRLKLDSEAASLKLQDQRIPALIGARGEITQQNINAEDRRGEILDRSITNRITQQNKADVDRIGATYSGLGGVVDRTTAGQMGLAGQVLGHIDNNTALIFDAVGKQRELDNAYRDRFLDAQIQENARNRPLAVIGQLGSFLAPVIAAFAMR